LPSDEEREQVATELKRFASDLNLIDDQKEKLRSALTEASEKIAEYMQENPNTTKADVIRKVVANRDEIRQRVVSFLSPERLKKWDDEKEKPRTSWAKDRSLRTHLVLKLTTLGWPTESNTARPQILGFASLDRQSATPRPHLTKFLPPQHVVNELIA